MPLLSRRLQLTDVKKEEIREIAAPTFFTPKDNFIDGGLISNNPTLDLMSDIHIYNAACMKVASYEKRTVHIGCIVSLGTGRAPPEELESMRWNFSLPGGLVEGASMFQDLMSLKNLLIGQITASNGPCVTRARSWAHDQSIPFFRFSPSLSSHVELDETNDQVIVGFLWDTEKYLRTDGRQDAEILAKYLKSL
ncbi:hypothetical protein WUBG_06561 [Wuchereria bancrofti]|uniref:PNPLA domain-containing protein n=1 Tax=Wuchereria bancrofti TaxID=6293 RepID=J9EK47_WUCBA|nr:hypothetical protein WUBG_06561 [Wuchereria bancrofti]